jgi:hypothetical protein
MAATTTTEAPPRVPWMLHAAFWIVLVESVLQGAYVITRDEFGPGGKALLLLAFAATVVTVFALVLSSLRAFPTPELSRP